ncbi:MAG: CcoQ/FixQ family Cbb3-type cytochrome c oxidase assembly chaperone [Sphingobacteriales bacterium]|nr:MAG: CcoQ/FixQ family Cbb3-type cytochrome c oxidase assembly chaperone [Sphingobacteriales bacterium]
MKFINYLEGITGVGIYPMTSLILFFLFFSALSVWAFKADKKYITAMKELPFAGNENNDTN